MNFAQLHSNEPLTRDEMVSITALVEYLAFTKGNHTENTYCHLAAEFKVTDVKELKRRDYDRAIKFLVDLNDLPIN
ncbi:MAG: hypothetical protein KGI37_06420 [Alphaproteobacteria bacterium]|nr:hypothetical protein [Alphaproteobacteria bacterium]